MRHRRIRLVEFINAFRVGGGEVQFVELLRGVADDFDVRVCALESVGPLLEKVRALGFIPEVFPLGGSLVHPATATQVWRLAGFLRRHQVQLVHAHDFYSALLAVPAARLARCQVVVSRLDLVHWHGPWRGLALAAATRSADHVVANAEAVARLVRDHERVPGDRVSVIYNGLDIAEFDRRQARGIEVPVPETGQAPVAILLANMHYEVKRQEDFLQALALARQRVPTLQAFLVGEGARRPYLEAEATRLGLRGVAHFLGSRSDAPGVWTRGTMGVLSSEREGLSNAIIEGMASRLPMVVTDAGGNAELVQDGLRGRVIGVRRPLELADALVELVTQPDRAREMGNAGRAFVQEVLSWERMIAAHRALYEGLVRSLLDKKRVA